MDFQALWLTLRLAVGTTAILLMLALPLAWWIASGRGAGRALVQSVVALPLVLPPTVLGFYLLVALGPLSAPGRLLIKVIGHPLAFSFTGLLVGSVIYSLPFAVQPLASGLHLEVGYGFGLGGRLYALRDCLLKDHFQPRARLLLARARLQPA